MRTVTQKDFNAFHYAVQEVVETSAKLALISASLPQIMGANEPLTALSIGLKGAESLLKKKHVMFKRFELAAFKFLGEKKRTGETSETYFSRICAMSEGEILAAPARNGLILRL